MAPLLKLLRGPGSGGVWTDPTDFLMTDHATPLMNLVNMMAAGALFIDKPVGGDEVTGVPTTATGDYVLFNWSPFFIDNRDNRLSGFSDGFGATFAATITMFLRVSNAAINATPKVWRATTRSGLITSPTAATISGAAACSAISSAYSGTNQIQRVTLTLPNAANFWKVGFTIAGTPAAGYVTYARAWADCCVILP